MVRLVAQAVQEVQHQYQEAALSYVRLMADTEVSTLIQAVAAAEVLLVAAVDIMTKIQIRLYALAMQVIQTVRVLVLTQARVAQQELLAKPETLYMLAVVAVVE